MADIPHFALNTRRPNFANVEVDYILNELMRYRKVMFFATGTKSNVTVKRQIWDRIAKHLQNMGYRHRNSVCVRKRWNDMQCATKIIVAKAESLGIEPHECQEWTDMHQKVLDILGKGNPRLRYQVHDYSWRSSNASLNGDNDKQNEADTSSLGEGYLSDPMLKTGKLGYTLIEIEDNNTNSPPQRLQQMHSSNENALSHDFHVNDADVVKEQETLYPAAVDASRNTQSHHFSTGQICVDTDQVVDIKSESNLSPQLHSVHNNCIASTISADYPNNMRNSSGTTVDEMKIEFMFKEHLEAMKLFQLKQNVQRLKAQYIEAKYKVLEFQSKLNSKPK